MRQIRFRGKAVGTNQWIYGYYSLFRDNHAIMGDDGLWVKVIPETVGQVVGLNDKNGKEIYEGDVIQYYSTNYISQQSHPDINPEIETCIIKKNRKEVGFIGGAFVVGDVEIYLVGLDDIDTIKETCGCVDDENTDMNGNEINEEVLGITVTGTIHD